LILGGESRFVHPVWIATGNVGEPLMHGSSERLASLVGRHLFEYLLVSLRLATLPGSMALV
jgi:hypothetical protein